MADNILKDIREVMLSEWSANRRITEAYLGKKFGVSRTSVREALKHIEEEGLIERRQGIGIRLKVTSPKELAEVYDIRILLEGLAVRYLAENITDSVLKKLKAANNEFNLAKKTKNDERIIAAETRFHQIIINNCNSPRLAKIIANLQLITRSFNTLNRIPGAYRYRKIIYPHERILKSLEAGDSEKSERLLRLHIEEGKNSVLRFLLGPSIIQNNSGQKDAESRKKKRR
jgi:DNA-binding GntR family transcriptional regulator